MEKIIGREAEQQLLANKLASKTAELIAIYGRRRVGKTFLIRNYYRKRIVFEFTGVHEAAFHEQLLNFTIALQKAMKSPLPLVAPENWLQAFTFLEQFLQGKISKEPIVVFFDEFPWIHTPKSGFLEAFDHWWNTWASRQPKLKAVICGSAASWMIENVINDRGGLHGRVSQSIRLMPFTLKETEAFLVHNGIRLDKYHILQVYMAMGGVPQYLKQINRGKSATQVIDQLCFQKDGILRAEFEKLYRSLFKDSSHHEAIVRVLSKRGKGMTRAEIIKACGLTSGGTTSRFFDELERSGFISLYVPFGKTIRDGLYKLSDEYSLFYLKFIEPTKGSDTVSWSGLSVGQSYISWTGFAFESVCQKHIRQIKKALGIEGVSTAVSGWRYQPSPGSAGNGAQVDLLLDRNDRSINICEIKFATGEFVIDKKYAKKLQDTIEVFRRESGTRKVLFPTMITTYGTLKNEYYKRLVMGEVRMGDLFG